MARTKVPSCIKTKKQRYNTIQLVNFWNQMPHILFISSNIIWVLLLLEYCCYLIELGVAAIPPTISASNSFINASASALIWISTFIPSSMTFISTSICFIYSLNFAMAAFAFTLSIAYLSNSWLISLTISAHYCATSFIYKFEAPHSIYTLIIFICCDYFLRLQCCWE